MKIRMDVESTEVTATLDDNVTSRDFVSVLAAKVGERESESAGEVLTAVLNSRK